MTHHMMDLSTIVEKPPDADILREMIGFVADSIAKPAVIGTRSQITGLLAGTEGTTVSTSVR